MRRRKAWPGIFQVTKRLPHRSPRAHNQKTWQHEQPDTTVIAQRPNGSTPLAIPALTSGRALFPQQLPVRIPDPTSPLRSAPLRPAFNRETQPCRPSSAAWAVSCARPRAPRRRRARQLAALPTRSLRLLNPRAPPLRPRRRRTSLRPSTPSSTSTSGRRRIEGEGRRRRRDACRRPPQLMETGCVE